MKIEGVPVEDANESLEITITKNDVRLGSKKDANSCAAARAACRQHHCDAAKFHFSRAYLKRGNKWVRYSVSKALRGEILAFDRGGTFEPGEYVITPVQPTVRLDAPLKRKSGPNNGTRPQRGNRPKKPYHVVTGVRARMNADFE